MPSIIRESDLAFKDAMHLRGKTKTREKLHYGSRGGFVPAYRSLDGTVPEYLDGFVEPQSYYRVDGNHYPDFEKLAYERWKAWWEGEKAKLQEGA